MGTIKLRRGTGSPAGSLAQYEVAMDVAAKNLYVSTDGTDAVILANKYDDSDAVTAIEDASSLTLSGSLTTESGLTNESGNYGQNLKANRENNETNAGGVASILVQRDLGTETLGGGFDSRGPAIDFNLVSDDSGLTQYQGGIMFQSNNDDGTDPEAWFRAYSWSGSSQDNIISANKDDCYIYGNLRAQNELIVSGVSEFNDTVTTNDKLEAKGKVELHDTNSEFSMDGADKFVVFDTPTEFTATNYGNIAHLDREETSTGGPRISGYTQVNYVDSNRALVNPGAGSGSQFAWGVNNSQFAQLGATLSTVAVNANNTIDYVNSASRIDFGVWTGDPQGDGTVTLTTALMIEPHQNQITLNSIDGGVTNLGTDGTGISFQAPELLFHADNSAKEIQFEVGSNLKLTVFNDKIESSVPVQFPTYTTTERNALTVSNGAQIYNSTTNKMQAYAGGAWVDLH